jgi:hypothetical protein
MKISVKQEISLIYIRLEKICLLILKFAPKQPISVKHQDVYHPQKKGVF